MRDVVIVPDMMDNPIYLFSAKLRAFGCMYTNSVPDIGVTAVMYDDGSVMKVKCSPSEFYERLTVVE